MSGSRERDKPRQGVVAITLRLLRNGAVGFIDWLGGGSREHFVIRKLIRIDVNVIWLRVSGKPDCINGSPPGQQSFDDTMHAIHHAALGREDDREAQIRRFNEPNMLDYRSPTRRLVPLGRERLSNFANVGQWNV